MVVGGGQSFVSFNPERNTETMSSIHKPLDRACHSLPTTSPADKLRALLSTNKRIIVPVVYDGLTARLVKLVGFEVRNREPLLVVGGSAGCTTMGISVWLCMIRCTSGKVAYVSSWLGFLHFAAGFKFYIIISHCVGDCSLHWRQ